MPKYFREVNKHFSGDKTLAARYMGVARSVLGGLVEMSGDVFQNARSVLMPDGTRITVSFAGSVASVAIHAIGRSAGNMLSRIVQRIFILSSFDSETRAVTLDECEVTAQVVDSTPYGWLDWVGSAGRRLYVRSEESRGFFGTAPAYARYVNPWRFDGLYEGDKLLHRGHNGFTVVNGEIYYVFVQSMATGDPYIGSYPVSMKFSLIHLASGTPIAETAWLPNGYYPIPYNVPIHDGFVKFNASGTEGVMRPKFGIETKMVFFRITATESGVTASIDFEVVDLGAHKTIVAADYLAGTDTLVYLVEHKVIAITSIYYDGGNRLILSHDYHLYSTDGAFDYTTSFVTDSGTSGAQSDGEMLYLFDADIRRKAYAYEVISYTGLPRNAGYHTGRVVTFQVGGNVYHPDAAGIPYSTASYPSGAQNWFLGYPANTDPEILTVPGESAAFFFTRGDDDRDEKVYLLCGEDTVAEVSGIVCPGATGKNKVSRYGISNIVLEN